jgi:bla regulator protein BlaR1
MTSADLSPLANHLWQSTVFAGAMWVLALVLRQNRAAVRYWLWLAASVKFLLPFSWLVSAGTELARRTAPAIAAPQWSLAVERISQPFILPAAAPQAVATPVVNPLAAVVLGVWFCGIAAGIVFWFRCWRQMRAARLAATPLPLDLPVPVFSSSMRLEPGVFGICRPVLLLPEGIAARLNPPQLEMVIAHELCHIRRRDNLTGALHMVVETLFWFHPLVWWIRSQLLEERERACDEAIIQSGTEPQVYAEGILKVCQYYLESPLACASGITGADLKKRIVSIMAGRVGCRLNFSRKLLLTATAVLAVAGPFLSGVIHTAQVHAQSPTTSISQPVFEVASVRRSAPPPARGDGLFAAIPVGIDTEPGKLTARNETLKNLIKAAWGVKEYQISGPEWLNSERYDIVAKAAKPVGEVQLRRMLQPLLAERFRLTLHRDRKEFTLYALSVDKNGPKITKSSDEVDPNINMGRGRFTAQRASLAQFADLLSLQTDRPVVDRTGLVGNYDITLIWAPDVNSGRDDASDPMPAIFTAVREQLGLKLQASKEPLEVLIIDHAEKVPIEN